MHTIRITLTGVPHKINEFFSLVREKVTGVTVTFHSRKAIATRPQYLERYCGILSSHSDGLMAVCDHHAILGLTVKYRCLED